jgi:hypothetical protein
VAEGGAFAERYPALFHVTDRAAVPLIARHGLRSAAALSALFEVPPARLAALMEANRDRYEDLLHPQHGRASLRRQMMPDRPLADRLAPGLTPVAWRYHVNGMVFLFASRSRACRLQQAEPTRTQVVLEWRTHEVLAHAREVRVCRYNNGTIDRLPPARRRLRSFADYVPIGEWCLREKFNEVAIYGGLPPEIGFIASEPARPRNA